jgi:hypothetical protein
VPRPEAGAKWAELRLLRDITTATVVQGASGARVP